jgi:integrase/recombinase XerD
VQIACKFFRNFIFSKGTKMKNTSVKISLDTRRAKADGTYPLILRLTHKRKTTSIKTGIHLRKED